MVRRGPPQKHEHVVQLAVTVRPDQMAAVEDHQKQLALLSRSAAVRSILDEWVGLKASLYRDEANRELSQRAGA